MIQAKPQQRIMQQSLALDSYLRTLLDEIPDVHEVDDTPLPVVAKAPVKPVVPLDEPPKAIVEPVVQLPVPELAAVENTVTLQALSVMPEWSRQEFQALFFKVGHLILAVPLTDLSRTIKIERRPGQIPGQPSWFLGLLDDQDSRIGVLDTGQLIFGKTRGSQRDLSQNPFKSILITEDKRWGLACDEILSIGRLNPEKVRWRTNRQKRPWLIGTVIEELTAIVDLQQLVPNRRRRI